MTAPDAVYCLSALIVVLAITAAGAGLFWPGKSSAYTVATLRGQSAQIYGQGLYRYDTVFAGAGYQGQDAVMLFLGVPLLLLSVLQSSRGSLTGHLLLMGTLAHFLYVYASMALGAAYNKLFLGYVAILSASLLAFVLMFASIDYSALAARVTSSEPQQGLGLFMLVSGLITLFVWGAPLVLSTLGNNPPPHLDTYTTQVTYALDLAIITPSAFVAGVLILRGATLGYVLAVPLLVIIILLTPQIILSTIYQKRAGVPFTKGEMIGPVAGFAVLGLIAIWLLVSLLQGLG